MERGDVTGLALGGVSLFPYLATETVIPGRYTEATQQDWPATATGKEPAMGSANTSTVDGMMDEVVEGLSRRGHTVIDRGSWSGGIPVEPSSWMTVEGEEGHRYQITVTVAR